jgi:hypothetical protein
MLTYADVSCMASDTGEAAYTSSPVAEGRIH